MTKGLVLVRVLISPRIYGIVMHVNRVAILTRIAVNLPVVTRFDALVVRHMFQSPLH